MKNYVHLGQYHGAGIPCFGNQKETMKSQCLEDLRNTFLGLLLTIHLSKYMGMLLLAVVCRYNSDAPAPMFVTASCPAFSDI